MRPLARPLSGFTLVEQIVAVAIAAILASLAIPPMQGLLRRQRAHAAAQALTDALHATRMLAIERQRRSLLCPSRDGRHCSPRGDWRSGWLIGLDRNDDGQPDGRPVLAHPALHGVRILASRGRRRVHYHPDGSAPGSNLMLRVCPVGRHPRRITAVVVSNAGRIRVQRIPGRRCP